MTPGERGRLIGRPTPGGKAGSRSAGQRALDRGDDRQRLRHAAGPDIRRRPCRRRRARRRRRRPRAGVATLRWVAGCSHMRKFIAGATSARLSVASSKVVARSSASPCAMRARRSAVAGATTTRSASRDNSIWPIAASSVGSNKVVADGLAAQRRGRQRRDEPLGRLGHDDAHRRAALAKAADQLERLIGATRRPMMSRMRAPDRDFAVMIAYAVKAAGADPSLELARARSRNIGSETTCPQRPDRGRREKSG